MEKNSCGPPTMTSNMSVLLLLLSVGLTAAAVVFGYARSLVIFDGLVRSAQTLHNSMFNAVVRTHVHFFDTNPIGELHSECPTTVMKLWSHHRHQQGRHPVSAQEDHLLTNCFACFVGRILNRFSKDVGQMDSVLPITFVDFYQVRHWIMFVLCSLCSFLLTMLVVV